MKKRNDIQMIGDKKRNAMIMGMKHRPQVTGIASSPSEQKTSPAQQKSVLEKMVKTQNNLGVWA